MRRAFENKKLVLGAFSVLLIFAIIVVSSFWPFLLDPNRIMTKTFLTDELIITAIVLSVTILLAFMAQASNAANKDSEIARAKVEFRASLSAIPVLSNLYQWIKKVLQPRDREEIAEREMNKLLMPVSIYYMEESEILSLTEPQKIGDTYYKAYPLEKLKKVIKLKKKLAKMKFVKPGYYTTVNRIEAKKNHSEIANGESMKKMATIVSNLLFRVLTTWIAASIMGSLIRDMAQDGGSSAQAWMRFLSRAFAFGSSSFLGYMLGCKMNDLDAFYIRKRIEVHKMFLEDKSFVPVDEGKEAFKERVMHENTMLIEHKEGSADGRN